MDAPPVGQTMTENSRGVKRISFDAYRSIEARNSSGPKENLDLVARQKVHQSLFRNKGSHGFRPRRRASTKDRHTARGQPIPEPQYSCGGLFPKEGKP